MLNTKSDFDYWKGVLDGLLLVKKYLELKRNPELYVDTAQFIVNAIEKVSDTYTESLFNLLGVDVHRERITSGVYDEMHDEKSSYLDELQNVDKELNKRNPEFIGDLEDIWSKISDTNPSQTIIVNDQEKENNRRRRLFFSA